MLWHRTFRLAVIIVISRGLIMPAQAAEFLQTRQLRVNGADLSYLDQGTGAPVVFVHGSFADLRFWEPQRQTIAQQYRFIAYTRRYHGTTPGPTKGNTILQRPIPPILPPSFTS
jgi:pimeloyl-ACP methyl ester carboxylesterase